MNKKSQFFIISLLIFSIAFTSMIHLLTTPKETSQNSIKTRMIDYNDFQSSLEMLNQLAQESFEYWPTNHEQSLRFSIKNTSPYAQPSQEIIIKATINESAIIESFYLSRKGSNPDFSISNLQGKEYLISFKESLSRGEEKNYNLLFSKTTDNPSHYQESKKASEYSESASIITYESSTYTAQINKSTGEIISLKLTGNNHETINSLKASINSETQEACESNYSFIRHSNNVLEINFTCELTAATFTQKYSFHPSFFSIHQEFEIPALGNYNLSYIADSALSSLATEQGINESLSQPTLTKYNSRYASLFTQDKGILIMSNDSAPFIITSTDIESEFRLNQTSYEEGFYSQEIIIMPYYNNYTSSIATATNYFSNPTRASIESKEDFLLKFNLLSSSILTNSFTQSSLSMNSTISDSKIASIANEPSNSFSGFSIKNFFNLNKTIQDESGNELSHYFSTHNYARNSSMPTQICNDNSFGISSTSFEFMKIQGEEIIASINTTDEITAQIINPLGESILSETFSSDSIISASAELNGVYELIISGNSCFEASVNCPLISAKSPIIINSSGNNELFFKANSQFTLQKTNIDSDARIILNNSHAVLINESGNFSEEINANHYSAINYYLNFSQGKFIISNNLSFGAKESYLSADYEISGAILRDFKGIECFKIIDAEPTEYCSMNYSSGAVNNTQYSIDFENNKFIMNEADWASSASLFSINGISAEYEGIAQDSCLAKSFEFSNPSASMILTAINNSNLFILDFENVKENFNLTINMKINGTIDTFFIFDSVQRYFNTTSSISSKNMIEGYNFIAKNDSGTYLAIIFHANDLMQTSNALIVHNNYIQIYLSKHAKKAYAYASNDYSELLRIFNGIRNSARISNEIKSYNSSFISQSLKLNGTFFG